MNDVTFSRNGTNVSLSLLGGGSGGEVAVYDCFVLFLLFSEHELTFTFAIYIYAIAFPSVCRLSVSNVRAPYSAG